MASSRSRFAAEPEYRSHPLRIRGSRYKRSTNKDLADSYIDPAKDDTLPSLQFGHKHVHHFLKLALHAGFVLAGRHRVRSQTLLVQRYTEWNNVSTTGECIDSSICALLCTQPHTVQYLVVASESWMAQPSTRSTGGKSLLCMHRSQSISNIHWDRRMISRTDMASASLITTLDANDS